MTKSDAELYKKTAESVYENSRQFLRQKNDYVHVMYYYIPGDMVDSVFSCESKMTVQVNQIIVSMQKEGYEILSVDLRPTFEDASFKMFKQKMYLLAITYK